MKKVNKLLSLLLTSVMAAMSLGSAVFAEEVKADSVCETEDRYLVEEKEYVLEDGTPIVERLYCNTDLSLVSTQSFSGSRPISYTKSVSTGHDDRQMLVAEIWVSGQFSWNNDPDNKYAKVSDADGGYTLYNDSEYVKGYVESGSDKGFDFLWGHTYAYARYNLKIKLNGGGELSSSVYVDCNINGVSTTA
ncbi:MAG: hypothetical protein NC228_02235 [[Eubacterium] siraeum]|nr:hypothetical protein [[Eubacterium] siraeum]